MGDLSTNFSRSEFDCRCGCGIEFEVSRELIQLIQALRDDLGHPLTINSGARCRTHNSATGGASQNSWHIPRVQHGAKKVLYACDISYSNMDLRHEPLAVFAMYAKAGTLKPRVVGLGLYNNRVHVDMRPGRIKAARWISSMPWDLADF